MREELAWEFVPSQTLVVHERRGMWIRRLRPRLADENVRWRETRSASDLARSLSGAAEPIVLVDLGSRPESVLKDLAESLPRDEPALVLVLDPERREWTHTLALELGATLALQGVVTPPEVEFILRRWIELAGKRRRAALRSSRTGPDDLATR